MYTAEAIASHAALENESVATLRQMLADVKAEGARHFATMQRSNGAEGGEYEGAEALEERARAQVDRIREILDRRAGNAALWAEHGEGRTSGRIDTRDGVPLGTEQRAVDWVRAKGLVQRDWHEQLDLGRYLEGFVTGRWGSESELEQRAYAEGTGSAGGYMVPTILVGQLIDLARNQARVLEAGAQLVPMTSNVSTIPVWASDPTVVLHPEANTETPSTGTLGQRTLTARTLMALVQASRELIEDSVLPVGTVLANALAAQTALKLDSLALTGTGSGGQPTGILNTSGINTRSMGINGATIAAGPAPLTGWGALATAAGDCSDNNEHANAAIMAPRSYREFGLLQDTVGQFIARPEILNDLQLLQTNQVSITDTQGTSTDASKIYVGDYRQAFVGLRTQLQLTTLTERYAESGQYGFVSWWRGDFVVARPKAFTVVSGVR